MTMATDIIPKRRMSEGIGYLGLTMTLSRALFPWVALSAQERLRLPDHLLGDLWHRAPGRLAALLTLRWAKGAERAACTAASASVSSAASLPALEASPPTPVQGRSATSLLWERLVDRDALKPSGIMFVVMFSSSCLQTFVVVYAIAKGIGNPGLFFVASAVAVAVVKVVRRPDIAAVRLR